MAPRIWIYQLRRGRTYARRCTHTRGERARRGGAHRITIHRASPRKDPPRGGERYLSGNNLRDKSPICIDASCPEMTRRESSRQRERGRPITIARRGGDGEIDPGHTCATCGDRESDRWREWFVNASFACKDIR